MVMTAVKEVGIPLVEGAASDLICLEPDWYPVKPVDCSWSSAMVCEMLEEEQKAEKMDYLQAQEEIVDLPTKKVIIHINFLGSTWSKQGRMTCQ